MVVNSYEDGYDDLSPEQLRIVKISLNTGSREYVGAHDDVCYLPEENHFALPSLQGGRCRWNYPKN